MINVNKTMADMAVMSDQQLKQTAVMNKTDPYMIALLSGESARRQAIRRGAQARAQKQPTVIDQTLAQMDAGQAQGMPEDSGIAQLPTPNMETMAAAEGGIVGYADGGPIAFAKAGVVRDPLAQYEEQIRREAVRQGVDPDMAMRLFKAESAGNTTAVSTKGATGLGQLMVDAAAEMGLKPEERTDPAKNIPASIGYFKKQLNTFKDPRVALAAYNFGPGNVKNHLAKNDGQLNKAGLPKETADYINKILPVGTAYAAPAPAQKPTQTVEPKTGYDFGASMATDIAPAATGIASVTPASAATGTASVIPRFAAVDGVFPTSEDNSASRIPGGYGVPTPPAKPEETSFMGRLADKMGLSQDAQRNISTNLNAFGGASGALYIPRYLPKVPGGLATLGERAYEILNPSKQMTPAQIETMRVANQGARVAEAAKTAEMAGALPGEALTAAQAVEAANAAKLAQLPSKAELVQDAAALRQAQEANRLATTGKVTQQVGQAAAGSAAVDEALKPSPTPAGGIPDLVEGSKEDFRRSELEAQYKAESPLQALAPKADATATAAAGEKPSLFTNERALMMGLQLLAGSDKPGTGSAIRDLLRGLGTAGLGTLAQEKEDRKTKAAEAGELARSKAYEGQGRKYAAEADILESGNKAAVQAATIAKDRMKTFMDSMQGKLADQPTRDRLYNQYLLDAYNQLGISAPTAMASAGTAGAGLKLLGVRPS